MKNSIALSTLILLIIYFGLAFFLIRTGGTAIEV